MNKIILRPGQLCKKVRFLSTGEKAPDIVYGWERSPNAELHFFDNASQHYISKENILLYLERYNETWSVVLYNGKKVYTLSIYLEAL